MTFWNDEPCEARKVTLVMADCQEFSMYWGRAQDLVGKSVHAVEVEYNSSTFYIYDNENEGWEKVTKGLGSPSYPHGTVVPVPGSVVPR